HRDLHSFPTRRSSDLDQALAATGKTTFENLCSACHKMDKKFIGPALDGVTERRSPEWIMNMILNPEEMIQKDPIAKQLMIESNIDRKSTRLNSSHVKI